MGLKNNISLGTKRPIKKYGVGTEPALIQITKFIKEKCMSYFNQITLVGRLVKDPKIEEKKIKEDDRVITKFTLAVNKNGDRENANFFPITMWDKTAILAGNILKKGHLVLVSGSINITVKTKEVDGKKVYETYAEVVGSTFQTMERKPVVETKKEQEAVTA
jgi:single-strand DNA-binding protein